MADGLLQFFLIQAKYIRNNILIPAFRIQFLSPATNYQSFFQIFIFFSNFL
jgi:hypothetical protein